MGSCLSPVDMISHLCISLLCLALVTAVPWDTDYDQNFDFLCKSGQYIKSIESVHDNGKEDRIFHFGCAELSESFAEDQLTNCEWSPYVNDFDALFEYQCPNDKIITGVSSYHDNGKEDRRYKFNCCQPGTLVTYHCQYTNYVNSYDHILSYRVPDGMVMKGVNSVHDNGKEGRIFKIDICMLGSLNNPEHVG